MFYIGCHLSSSKGFYHMGKEALSIGANTFQFFTRNPRGGAAKALDFEDVQAFINLTEENPFGPLIAHAPYTLNLASNKEETRLFSREMMIEDLRRLEHLPGNYYNFHPGSHVKQGEEKGMAFIVEALNQILWEEMNTTVLLETMAGKGTELGKTFEQLKQIIDELYYKNHVGICLDTCHVFDGGYNIVNQLDQTLERFDKIIGIHHLKAIHLNDSKNPLGSRKDRHAKLGEGYIGKETIVALINHMKLPVGVSFVLETPNDLSGYEREINYLKTKKIM